MQILVRRPRTGGGFLAALAIAVRALDGSSWNSKATDPR